MAAKAHKVSKKKSKVASKKHDRKSGNKSLDLAASRPVTALSFHDHDNKVVYTKAADKDTFQMDKVLLQNACPDLREKQKTKAVRADSADKEEEDTVTFSRWYRHLKREGYGQPPSAAHFRKAKHRWTEETSNKSNVCADVCNKGKKINPFSEKKKPISGGYKRRIVEKWGKMWDSALSDLKFDRIVFENNPDAEQAYPSDKDRINDGCRKLWSIARMNQNIITMMMKKFVSGPPNKLYTLNRIEAAQCWNRILDENGLVSKECCVDVIDKPLARRKRFNIPSLKKPDVLKKDPGVMRKSNMYKLPEVIVSESLGKTKKELEEEEACYAEPELLPRKKNSAYWLDPTVVPPVSKHFNDDEFEVDPHDDPTGELRRELAEAKIIAKRYTRFAHIIEKSIHVVPNSETVNQLMDKNFVEKDPAIRRQTLLQNFFSSHKIEASKDFKRDALFATILSRSDNPKDAVSKKPYPYNLAEDSKLKFKKRAQRS